MPEMEQQDMAKKTPKKEARMPDDMAKKLLCDMKDLSGIERQRIRDEIVLAHQWLIAAVIQQKYYNADPITREDLEMEGNVGLIEAVDRFDIKESKSCKFVSYASTWVQRRMREFFYSHVCDQKEEGYSRANALIPGRDSKANRAARQAQNFIDGYYIENGRVPDDETVIKKFGITGEEAREIISQQNRCVFANNISANDDENESEDDILALLSGGDALSRRAFGDAEECADIERFLYMMDGLKEMDDTDMRLLCILVAAWGGG